MEYILVENRQIVHLHMPWRPRFFQSELDELEVDYVVSEAEQGYIKINDNFEIIPITSDTTMPYDSLYQTLVGPFYTYGDREVSIGYAVYDQDLDTVKNSLKIIAATERYRREGLGVTATINGQQVSLYTSREARGQYTDLVSWIGDGTVKWKFNTGFVLVDKTAAQAMLSSVLDYVQQQYDWEYALSQTIDNCTTIDELRAVVIMPPVDDITK